MKVEKRFKTSMKRFGFFALLSSLFLLTGCEDAVLINSKGLIGIQQRDLIYTAVGLMLIVVIPAILLSILFAWKYRTANKANEYKPNWAHSNKIEFVVWTIPIAIIIVLATITWRSTHALDPYKPIESDKKPLVVQVVALDWKWLFIYPEQGVATVNELAFPANRPIEFRVTSDTVMNSFFIPQLGGQIYAMAGMQTKLHLLANEPGRYKGVSASFSGRGFSDMKFTAIATPDEAGFAQWVDTVRQSDKHLDSMAQFKNLAEESVAHPVTYFATVSSGLFQDILTRYPGSMNAQHHEQSSTPEMSHMNHSNVEQADAHSAPQHAH